MDSIQERNFRKAMDWFNVADSDAFQEDNLDLDYERLNVLITGLRSIIAIEQTSGYGPQVAQIKERARFILAHIGA